MLPLPIRLLLFGTGPEIEPITQLAGNLGWMVEHFRPAAQTGALIMNLFAPAGLDIGSEAPKEIVLSITSEIAAVFSNRSGGFSRQRKSDIHATNVVSAGGEAA